jgi:hypothetical protein
MGENSEISNEIFSTKKKKRKISLNPLNFRAFCKHPQSLKTLTLVFPISNCFQFANSVRILCEILTDPTKIIHLSLTLELRRFGLQNYTVLGFKKMSF